MLSRVWRYVKPPRHTFILGAQVIKLMVFPKKKLSAKRFGLLKSAREEIL